MPRPGVRRSRQAGGPGGRPSIVHRGHGDQPGVTGRRDPRRRRRARGRGRGGGGAGLEMRFVPSVRPGTTHPARGAMGFCIFNNVALAARYAQQTHHIGKVAIVDWDVHHGNGTQNIFYEDPSVFFFSTHQSPWYPYTGPADETGQGAGLSTTMNFPFAAGAGRPQIFGAMQDKLLPALQGVQAGVDPDLRRLRLEARRSARPIRAHRPRLC